MPVLSNAMQCSVLCANNAQLEWHCLDCWSDNKQYNSVPVRLLTRALSHTHQGNGNGSYAIKELDNNTIISGTYGRQSTEMIARGDDGAGRLFLIFFLSVPFLVYVRCTFLSFFKFHFDSIYFVFIGIRHTDTNNWMIEKVQKTLDRLSRSRLRLGCSNPDKYTRHARKQTIMTPTTVVRNSQGKVRLEILYPHVGQLCNTISTLGAKGGQVGEHNRSSKMRWRLEYNPCNVWKQ